MPRETLAFRIDPEKREALDDLAEALDRDRSYLINEAIEHYLDLNRWQVDLIKTRLAEADAGVPGAPQEQVFVRLRRRLAKPLPKGKGKVKAAKG
jgi:predicted transcriptional regulator